MARTKVYGFVTNAPRGWEVAVRCGASVRVIIRATSRLRAADAAQNAGLNVTVHYLATYGATTGNKDELAAAVLDRVVFRSVDHAPWRVAPLAPVRGSGRQARYPVSK